MQRSSVGAPGAPPSSGHLSGGEGEGDNRSRNAKAQRRHREKRKAHFKALEESVQILTQQLEEARRQLGAATYANSARFAYSPESKDLASLSAENAYLRDENADLRRQLYTLRVNYGGGRDPGSAGGTLPPPTGEQQPKVTTGIWPEVKSEGNPPYSGVYSAPGSAVVSSPRVGSSSHGRTQSHPGDFVRDPAAESSSSTYPPPLYQQQQFIVEDKYDPTRHQPRGSSSSSRGRVMSSSSAPSQSPYVTSQPFPTDPRAHALGTPTQPYMVRYEGVYPAVPPPHNMPRSAMSSSSSYPQTPVAYVPRADEVWSQQQEVWQAPSAVPQQQQ